MRYEERRIRRSHFMLRESLFNYVTADLSAQQDSSSRLSLRSALIGLGVVGASGIGALAIYKKLSSEEELEDLPGMVEKEAESDPDLNPSGAEALKKSAENLPEFSKPEVKPIEDSPSFWSKLKGFFKVEKPPDAPVSQVGKTAEQLGKPRSVLIEKLPGTFRSKFAFSGVVGAKMLSEMGSYTQQEANTIIGLKTSNAKTGVTGTVPLDVETLIMQYSNMYGVDSSLALKIAKMESGGNPNAISSTGAIGVYQLTGRTASDYGVTNRFDIAQNVEAGIKILAKSGKKLATENIPATAVNLYLIHQLGTSGAMELLRAASKDKKISQLSPSLQRAIRLNAGGKSATTAQGYVQNTSVLLEKKSSVVASARPATGALPTVENGSTTAAVMVAEIPMQSAAPSRSSQDIRLTSDSPRVSSGTVTSSPANVTPSNQRPSRASPQQVVKLKNGSLVATQ